MRILIDLGHPAHIHYFKNFINIMKGKGHEFAFSARDKEVLHYLLDNLAIPYKSRGKGGKTLLSKIFYLFVADYIIYKMAKDFKPDIFLSFASTYAAHVSWILRKPHIVFDDTEHSTFELLLYPPFSDVLLNPKCFYKNLGKKQIKFDGYMELCSLHPNYYNPNRDIISFLGVKESDKYALLRFVSWDASHDVGHSGLDYKTKIQLVNLFSLTMKVFISSEKSLPKELNQYQIKIPPQRMHDVLAFATLFVGEGATMASECAMLGTPAIYVNSLDAGTLKEQEKYGLLFGFRNSEGVIEKVNEILATPNLKKEFQVRRQQMLVDKIDVTGFMVWFVENYPGSVNIMKSNPDYQYSFK
jgi:uncharacterized protein